MVSSMDDEEKPKGQLIKELAEMRRCLAKLEGDAAEQVPAKKEIVKDRNQLDSVFRAAPIGIGVVIDRKIQFANELLYEMLGYREEELLGQLSRIVYPSDKEFERVGKYKYEEIQEKGTGTIETVLQRKDGSLIDVLLSSTPLDPQDLSQGVTFTVLDITERKEAEQKIQKSEAEFRLLADHTFDWEYWINLHGKYVYISSACESITGYSPEEFSANPKLLSEIIKPEYAAMVRTHYEDENHEKAQTHSMEFPITTKDGAERWLAHNCIPIFDEEGNFAGRRGNNRDITERVRAKENLKTLNTVTAALSSSLDLEYVLELILEQVSKVISMNSGTIFLHEDKYLQVVADRGVEPSLKGKVYADTDVLFKETQKTRRPVILANAQEDPRFKGWGGGE